MNFLRKIVARRPGARGRNAVYGSYRFVDNGHAAVRWIRRLAGSAGQGDMTKKVGSEQPGSDEGSGDSAKRIADEIGPLIRLARSRGFDFLAYLLAMVLKEARRLAGQ